MMGPFLFPLLLLFALGQGRELGPFNPVPETFHSPLWTNGTLNIVVLLPFEAEFMGSLKRVGPAIHLAIDEVRQRDLIPHHSIRISYQDSQCSNIIAPMRATRETSCSGQGSKLNMFIGPSCELALASVARSLQFWNIPLITGGGLTGDFTEHKTVNGTEFFLLTRTGYSFRDMSFFLLSHFHRYGWKKVMLMYEKDGHADVSGTQTCRLFMATLVEVLKGEKMPYGSFDLQTNNVNATTKDNLKQELGLKYSD